MFTRAVWPSYRRYVEPAKENAEFIITNNYTPSKESPKIRKSRIFLRADFVLEEERLLRLGAKKRSSYAQKEIYMAAPNRSLEESDESVCIKIIDNRDYSFIYEGPRNERNPLQRYVLTFPVDKDAVDFLRSIGYRVVSTVESSCTTFDFKNLEVKVVDIQGLGRNIEICLSKKTSLARARYLLLF